jgi:hypothetical protein
MSTGKDSIYDHLEPRRQVSLSVYVAVTVMVLALAWIASGGPGVLMAIGATVSVALASMVR